MAVPLRKDMDQQQDLTTADLAQGARANETAGPKPLASERAVAEVNRSESQTSTPLFPTTNSRICAPAGKKSKPTSWMSRAKPSSKRMVWLRPR